MNDKLVKHIKRKLEDKNEIFDHFDVPRDDQVKYLMLATMQIVNDECRQCFYCKNYRGFSLRSECRIKPDTVENCFHFSLDTQKVLKKKYHHICMTTSECTRGMYLIDKYSLVKSEYDIFDYTVYVCPYAPYVNRFPDYWRNTDKDYVGTFLSVFRTDEQTNNEVMKSLNENEYTMTSFCNGGELLVVVPDEDEEGFLRAVKKSAPNAQTKMFDCFIPESGAERRVYHS